MIHEPYKDIRPDVVKSMQSLITPADSYHADHKRRMARTIQVLLDQNPSGSLLEVGTSHLIPLVLDEVLPGLAVTVTDFDLTQPVYSNMEVSLNGVTRVVPCARVNIENEPLPFEDETFDYILLCEVLEHMEIDPMFMLAEINRVMKTGGTLILSTPNAVSTWSITKMLKGFEPYFYMQYRHDRSLYRHNYEYSIHSLAAVIKAAGFDGSAWTEDSFEEPNYTHVLKLKEIGYDLHHVGDNLFTVAKKISGVVNRYPGAIYCD